MSAKQIISGKIVDILARDIYPARLTIEQGKILSIERIVQQEDHYILPGFIDSHVHIESSLLIPSEFARLAVTHGTIATVSDPHEIANVCGMEGIDFMINNGAQVPFKFYFGAPSCVPATLFETSGSTISVQEVEKLLRSDKVKYLAEMMNWPGVLYDDPSVYAKIKLADTYQKPVDGHAPGLFGEEARKYIQAGISTDHECFTKEEALNKLNLGMKILIREGSAAKNFEALISLLNEFEDNIMFCSDDKHPDSLLDGHINVLVRRAIDSGIDLFKVLKAACINPVNHYKLDIGMLREGDPADFIIVDDLKLFDIKRTYINGELVAEAGKSLISSVVVNPINNFDRRPIEVSDIKIQTSAAKINVIEALDGQLVTNHIVCDSFIKDGYLESNPENDLLKIIVVNRYANTTASIGFIKNFGLKQGAIASSVAHDSHNIIAVGTSDEYIVKSVNQLIGSKGGLSAVSEMGDKILDLPIGGIMTSKDAYEVAKLYTEVDQFAKNLGSKLSSPFMTLSFMALLVIPSLKISDLGLFNGDKFEFVPLESYQ